MSALTFETLSAELTQALCAQRDTPPETTARCTLGRGKVMVLVEYPLDSANAEPMATQTLDWLEQFLRAQFDNRGLPETAVDLAEGGSEVSVQLFLKHLNEFKPFTMRSFIWKVDDGFDDLFGSSTRTPQPMEGQSAPAHRFDGADAAYSQPVFQRATGSAAQLATPQSEAALSEAALSEAALSEAALSESALSEAAFSDTAQTSVDVSPRSNSSLEDAYLDAPHPDLHAEAYVEADEPIPVELEDDHLPLELEPEPNFEAELGGGRPDLDSDLVPDLVPEMGAPEMGAPNIISDIEASLEDSLTMGDPLTLDASLSEELALEAELAADSDVAANLEADLAADLSVGVAPSSFSAESAADFSLPGEAPELGSGDLNLPTLELPGANIPDIASSDADFFDVESDTPVGTSLINTSALDFNLPENDFGLKTYASGEADLEDARLNPFNEETLEASDLEAPDLEASDLDVPDLEAPDLEAPDLDVPDLSEPDLSELHLDETAIAVSTAEDSDLDDSETDDTALADSTAVFSHEQDSEAVTSELLDLDASDLSEPVSAEPTLDEPVLDELASDTPVLEALASDELDVEEGVSDRDASDRDASDRDASDRDASDVLDLSPSALGGVTLGGLALGGLAVGEITSGASGTDESDVDESGLEDEPLGEENLDDENLDDEHLNSATLTQTEPTLPNLEDPAVNFPHSSVSNLDDSAVAGADSAELREYDPDAYENAYERDLSDAEAADEADTYDDDPAYYLDEEEVIEEEPFEDVAAIDEGEVQRQREQWQKQSQKNPWIFVGALGFTLVGVLGFIATRPCTVGSCDRIQVAQTTSEEAIRDLRTDDSQKSVIATKQQLKRSIGMLSAVPIWSPHYAQAQADLSDYRSQVKALDLVDSAQGKAYQAAVESQNPPHPVKKWQKIANDWLDATESLKAVPADSPVRDLADRKLAEYRANRATILVRIDAESKAEVGLRQAQNNASMGTKQMEVASSAEAWEEALASWEAAVDNLSQIPQGTKAYAEAQQLLPKYMETLDEVRSRALREVSANDSLVEAKQLAISAQRAETEEQWSVSIDNWRRAYGELQEIPAGTLAHAESKALLSFYATSLNQSENNMQVALRFQSIEPNFFAACGVTATQTCTYSVRGGKIRLDLFEGYDAVIDQSITPPDQRVASTVVDTATGGAVPAVSPQFIGNGNRLLQNITLLGTQAQVPIEMYDSKGELLATYRPDLEGFTR